jgi:hypothetical protein
MLAAAEDATRSTNVAAAKGSRIARPARVLERPADDFAAAAAAAKVAAVMTVM